MCPLKIRAGFFFGGGWGPWHFLGFRCLSFGLSRSCLGTSKQGRPSSPTLLVYINIWCRSGWSFACYLRMGGILRGRCDTAHSTLAEICLLVLVEAMV